MKEYVELGQYYVTKYQLHEFVFIFLLQHYVSVSGIEYLTTIH